MFAQPLSHVWVFVTPWTVTHQAPLSMGFPRQEYWTGLPFPSLADIPNTRIEPASGQVTCSCQSPPNKCYFLFWQQGSGPQTQRSPSKVHAWLRGGSWQLPQGQVPRTHPAIIAERARYPGPNWSLASSGCPEGRGWAHKPDPRQTAPTIRLQRQEQGRGSPLPQGLGLASGWPWWGLWRPAGHSFSLFPGPPRSAASHKPCELESPWETARSHLLPHTSNPPLHQPSGTAPLMVTQWQLLVWGRHPLWCLTNGWATANSRVGNCCQVTAADTVTASAGSGTWPSSMITSPDV